MKIPESDTVVIPDIHGHLDKLEDVYERYGEEVRYVLLGDIVDGDEVKHTLDVVNFMVTELGGVAIKGNHEYVLDAALNAADREERHRYRHQLWRKSHNGGYKGYERGTLRSYDIEDETPTSQAASELKERLRTTGHMALIREMPLFVEAPDFIGIHAGLTSEPWVEQRENLELEEKQLVTDEPTFSEEPDQLFGRWVDNNGTMYRDHSISSSPVIYTDIGDKVLVTGHSHMDIGVHERVSQNGKRVRLASRLGEGQPLYVYQTWDGQVVAV